LRPAGKTGPAPSASAISSGGRIVPEGEQSSPAVALGLAVSRGKIGCYGEWGPGRNSLTILEREEPHWDMRHLLARTKGEDGRRRSADWRSVFMGIAFVVSTPPG
jgi:hypothetical protein